MNIKKQLYLSNTLMLIVPVILSIISGAVLFHLFWRLIDTNEGSDYGSYFKESAHISSIANDWRDGGSKEKAIADIEKCFASAAKGEYSVLIYDGEQLCYNRGVVVDTKPDILDQALKDTKNRIFITDNCGIYTEHIAPYTIALVKWNYNVENDLYMKKDRRVFLLVCLLLIAIVVAVVYFTNRLLTKKVFRSISIPLDTLAGGVNQIRDGDLDTRIDYNRQDEFLPVCDAFNEMAVRLKQMVDASQKNDTNRRELIAGIAHDLRTPLTAIKAYVEGLEKGVASSQEQQKKYLDTIKHKASDLEHIVNQLFLFSKLDIGDFPLRLEKIDLADLLNGYIKNEETEFEERGLTIVMDSAIDDSFVRVDIVQIHNVFDNILENSLKYGSPDHKVIHISCLQEDSYAQIVLSDNGPGVDKSHLEKLFDVFYRADKSRSNTSQGSGLGLAISAKIVEQHGGNIRAENADSGGLSIIITLPLIQKEEQYGNDINY